MPYAGESTGGFFFKTHAHADAFKEFIDVEFEGHKYMAIKGYDEYLTVMYGDWRTPPPPEKQITHHDSETDLNTPYTQIVKAKK